MTSYYVHEKIGCIQRSGLWYRWTFDGRNSAEWISTGPFVDRFDPSNPDADVVEPGETCAQIAVEDLPEYADLIWDAYAGDEAALTKDRARFEEWIGPGGSAVAERIEWREE